jgi:NAD(P)-dependent dehydrogenase (short-subunit alcohol dehydrogenase family)
MAHYGFDAAKRPTFPGPEPMTQTTNPTPKKPGFSGRRDPTLDWQRRPPSALQLTGTRVAVVGGTNGLGRALARVMAERGAHVIVVGQTFRDEGTKGIEFVKADLSRMREAKRVGAALPAESLDLVVLTTGIIAAPTREVTAEGLERDLAVSYLSRLAVLREVAPRLGTGRASGAPAPRVFVMGFPGTGEVGDADDLNSERTYAATSAHMQTVAGNEALVLDAVRRYPQLRAFGLNPGLIKTDIRSNFLGQGSLRHRLVEGLIGAFTISPQTYAERIVPLLFAPELEARSGAMFNQKGHAIAPSEVLTVDQVARLIAASEGLLARATAH